MTLPHALVLLSVVLSLTGSFTYLRDTLRGTTKPNRISWFMWALAPIASSVVAVSAGADIWGTVRVFIGGFFPLVIFIISFYNPQSYWKLTVFDVVCGVLSFLALTVWLVVREAEAAIILLLLGDAFASIPTLRKAWHNPETETGSSYILYALASLLAFTAIPQWNIENAAFQIYLFSINVILAFPIYRMHLQKSGKEV